MSWEAWGTPPDPEPGPGCPLCGGNSHNADCELGKMQVRALEAEREVRSVRLEYQHLTTRIGELSQAMGSPAVCGKSPETILSATVALATERLKPREHSDDEARLRARHSTQDACGQLMRYGDGVASAGLLAVLWKLTDINDDMQNGRDPKRIRTLIDEATEALAVLRGSI